MPLQLEDKAETAGGLPARNGQAAWADFEREVIEHFAEISRALGHLSELAAECWLKAATRWQTSHAAPARFASQQAETPASPKPATIVFPGTPESS